MEKGSIQMADKTCAPDFFAGFVVGALVGAAAALLFAPQSGEETRILIRDKGIELREQADDLSVEARRRAERLQAQMKQAVNEGKSAASTKKEQLLSQLDEASAAEQLLEEG
jgi:gas vesicle protein